MAVGPLARLLAQLVVPVVAVLARALPAAYAQALQNAKKAGVDAAEASAPVFGRRIARNEALQILNLSEAEATPEAIQKVSQKKGWAGLNSPYILLLICQFVPLLCITAIRKIFCSQRCQQRRKLLFAVQNIPSTRIAERVSKGEARGRVSKSEGECRKQTVDFRLRQHCILK